MSGRIRTVKPEWLEDELLALASSDARVLSIALVLLADDHGRGRANRVMLAGNVFPGKPLEILGEALEELRALRYVHLYEIDGQAYFAIRNWFKHQKVDHPSKGKVPAPPEDSSVNSGIFECARETLDIPRESVDDTRASRDPLPSLPGIGTDPASVPVKAQARPKRATRPPSAETELTDDWKPTQEHAVRATKDQLNLEREVDRFRAHAKTNNTLAISWNGKFTTWLINAVEFRERDGRAPPRRPAAPLDAAGKEAVRQRQAELEARAREQIKRGLGQMGGGS